VISLQPPCSEPIIYEDLSTININLKSFCYRYPLFFESRLGDGLLLSFAFIQSGAANCVQRASPVKPTAIKPKDPSSPASFAKPGISRIYKLIRSSRNSRNKFLSSVIRKFDFGASGIQSVPFLVYVRPQFILNLFSPFYSLAYF
jgi:cohesin loading factor subunit SCC2